jgi:hypothetical protein
MHAKCFHTSHLLVNPPGSEDVFLCTFFRGANFGGSSITKSHSSFFEIAPFMNAVASPFMNDIFPGLSSLRTIFSFARSSADPDESRPENGYIG